MKKWLARIIIPLLVVVTVLFGMGGNTALASELAFHSGFEFNAFTEWSSTTGSPSVTEGNQSLVTQDSGGSPDDVFDDEWRGQTFTTPSSGTAVRQVWIYTYEIGSPTEDWVVSIKATDGSSHPTGADLVSVTIPEADIVTTGWTECTFSTAVSLTGSTLYAVVIRTSGTGDDYSNKHRIDTNNGNPYASGALEDSDDGGASWSTLSSYDMKFRLYSYPIPHTGDYMMKANATSSYVQDLSSGVKKLSFYMYIVANEETTNIAGGTGGSVTLEVDSDYHLNLYDGAGTLEESGTTSLGLYTWNRISLSINGANCKVYINGVEELSSTGMSVQDTIGRTGLIDGIASSVELYFDNTVYSTTVGTTDLGDIRVTWANPSGNDGTNQYDQTSGYTYVDEWTGSPLWDDSDYIEDNQGGLASEKFLLPDYDELNDTIGASDTIEAVTIWTRGDRDGGGATMHNMWAGTTLGGTDSSGDLDFDSIAWYNWYLNMQPNDVLEWSLAQFDTLFIGMQHNGGQDQRVHCMVAMIAYKVSAGATPDISNTPSSKGFGTVSASTTYWSAGSEPTWPLVDGDAYFTVTNNSGAAVDIDIKATNFTGGVGWTLTSGSPGSNTVRLTVFEEGDGSGDGLILTTSDQAFIASLADSGDKDWELKMETGTFTDGALKTSTITLTASLSWIIWVMHRRFDDIFDKNDLLRRVFYN